MIKVVMSVDEAVFRIIRDNWTDGFAIFRVEEIAKRICNNYNKHYAELKKMIEDWWDSLERDEKYDLDTVKLFKYGEKTFSLTLSQTMGYTKWNILGYGIINATKKTRVVQNDL